MWLDENMRKMNQEEVTRLNIESFGEIMDHVIEDSKVGLAVTKEAGETEWTVHGAGCGAVMDFYIYLNALEVIYLRMMEEMEKIGGIDAEKLADVLCEEVKKSMVAAAKERTHEK